MGNAVKSIIPGTKYTAVPGKSPEELALAREQAELLKLQRAEIEQQARDRDLLMPAFLESSGLRAVKDAAGNITGYERTERGLQDAQIEELMRTRELAALKGELPVNPSLIRELDEGQRSLEERLRRNLGSGFETSTPGMDALATAEQRRVETLDAARRGDISQMGQLLESRSNIGGQQFSQLFNTSQSPLATSQAFGQAAAGFNQPLSTYLQDRNLTANIGVANMQQWLNRRKAAADTFAKIFGSAMGGK